MKINDHFIIDFNNIDLISNKINGIINSGNKVIITFHNSVLNIFSISECDDKLTPGDIFIQDTATGMLVPADKYAYKYTSFKHYRYSFPIKPNNTPVKLPPIHD